MINEWSGVLHTLNGLENSRQDGTGISFNFILSNGARTQQRDRWDPTDFTHMMPKDSRTVSVSIYSFNDRITGLKFFEKDRKLTFKIGDTNPFYETKSVALAENEVIIGVVAKLYPGSQSQYTNF